jgi:hypothetical protein
VRRAAKPPRSSAPRHDLWFAARWVDDRKARSRQVQLGASDVGTCMRQVAYILTKTPKSDKDESEHRQAILGTWIHKGALWALHKVYGAIIEVRVGNGFLKGHADAYYQIDAVVEDLKTRSRLNIDNVRVYGPARLELFQVHIYADLVQQGAFQRTERRLKGEQLVLDVRLRYVSRDDGDEFVWQQPYDPEIAKEAWAWLAEARSYTDPTDAPRGQNGPGLSVVCDNCEWRTACWGDRVLGRKPQWILLQDDEDVAEALIEYEQLRVEAADLDARRALNRSKLDGHEKGVYAKGAYPMTLVWSNPKPGPEKPDVEAMTALLAEAGVPIPMTRKPPGEPSITVRRSTEKDLRAAAEAALPQVIDGGEGDGTEAVGERPEPEDRT